MMEARNDDQELLQGQAKIWQHMFGFVDSMLLKCAVELRIADIISSHGGQASLPQIASSISPSSDISFLARIMPLLVRRGVFTVQNPVNGSGEPLYGPSESSRWLLHDSELSLAPMILMQNHQLLLDPWHYLNRCIKEGGIAFERAHGHSAWDLASRNSNFNKLFNNAMSCSSKIVTRAILSGYKQGFSSLESLVDVGGGTGSLVAEIVKAHPHIKGINFDLAHVVTTAPVYKGVSHVTGDIFQAIPKADAAILKWILHDWSDEDCVKILRNCRDAIPTETGKVIIVECILRPEGSGMFDHLSLVFDLLMMVNCSGRERTELEWKKLLEEGGFPRYKIINIPAHPSIIEAYPK